MDAVLIHYIVDKLWTKISTFFVLFISTLCGPYVHMYVHIFVDNNNTFCGQKYPHFCAFLYPHFVDFMYTISYTFLWTMTTHFVDKNIHIFVDFMYTISYTFLWTMPTYFVDKKVNKTHIFVVFYTTINPNRVHFARTSTFYNILFIQVL